MAAVPKKTIKLSDGREVAVDVTTLTRKEFRGFWDVRVSDKESDAVIARLCNEKTEFIETLLNDDYRRIFDTVVTLANRPLDDPNSQSASI